MRRVRKYWALAATATLICVGLGCGSGGSAKLERALVGRGRVAVVGPDNLLRTPTRGAELVPAARSSELAGALRGSDATAVARAMQAAQIQALLVDARRGAQPAAKSIAAQLASYARLPGLQGAFLSPTAALYVLDPVRDWSPSLRAGLAEVARRLIGGAAPPHLRSFPEVARRMEPAEVMVLLRNGSKPRLWRSARGSSFARALLTACDVARQRWTEREQAMGGPLDRILPRLQVEVALLQDDGQIGDVDESFVNRVVLPVHGVAYEHKGAWRYMLPEATHAKDIGTPSRAYARLFAEDGLPEDSLRSQELRPYRVAVQVIGISAAPQPRGEPKDGLSEVKNPREVLGD